MSKATGTYLVEFSNGDKYVFGNNYKDWWYHAIELQLERSRKNVDMLNLKPFKRVYYSQIPFVDDGGLKYCIASDYQDIINEISDKYGTKLTPFSNYTFQNSPDELDKLNRELKRF